jgi:hypothetical protein
LAISFVSCLNNDATPVEESQGWRSLPSPPLSGRILHSTNWTGEELVVWGGQSPDGETFADGAVFEMASQTWRPMASSPLQARAGHTAAWTGDELVVWGGHDDPDPIHRLTDGAAYDPGNDTWRKIASPDLTGGPGYASTWTGEWLMFVGGNDGTYSFAENGLNEAALYDPSSDSWQPLVMPGEFTVVDAFWTGTEVVVFGVRRYLTALVGLAFDPATGRWLDLPAAPVSPAVPDIEQVGDEVLAWAYDPETDGIAALDLDTMHWTELPALPGIASDGIPTAVSLDESGVFMQSESAMAIYSDSHGAWEQIDGPAPGVGPSFVQPVWTGSEILFFDAGLPPGDPNAPEGVPQRLWAYRP